jgi:hypothetical protein
VEDREAIEQVFRLACFQFVASRRKGDPGEAFFNLANAIEDAFPEIIVGYRSRIGVEPFPESPE